MKRQQCIAIFLAVTVQFAVGSFAEATLTINGTVTTRTAPDASAFNTLTSSGGDAVATEIFDKMVASTQNFSFVDVTHASQHFGARKAVIAAIEAMKPGGGIDFGYGDPPTFPAGFQHNPGGRTVDFKQSDATQSASAGITAIETGSTRADCLCALNAAILVGHRHQYGNAWIDAQLAAGSVVINGSFKFTAAATDAAMIPGDFVYMANAVDYAAKADAHGTNPAWWNGENTIYVGNGKYSGLGLWDQTEDQLRAAILDGYNNDTGSSPKKDATWASANINFTTHERIAISPKQ